MTETTIFVAHKTPHTTGSKDRAFDTLISARNWLEDEIENEPNVKEWDLREQNEQYPMLLYEVVNGKGKVAGTIQEIVYRHE